jgi:hypothetical protein
MTRLGSSRMPGFVLIAAATAVGLGGCGGSSTSSGTSTVSTGASARSTTTSAQQATSPPSGELHSTLIAHLNALCSRGNAEINAVNKAEHKSTQQETEAFNRALAIYRASVPEFEGLHPTAADQAAFTRYLGAVKRQEGAIVRLAVALRANETEALSGLESLDQTYSKERITAAIDLGAEKCGAA